MNRADLMLAVLKDGRPHTRHEIHAHAGEFFLTNNAASELRAHGHNVVRSVETVNGARVYSYQLVCVDGPANPGEASLGRSTHHRTGDVGPSTHTSLPPGETAVPSGAADSLASADIRVVAAGKDATRVGEGAVSGLERRQPSPTQLSLLGAL